MNRMCVQAGFGGSLKPRKHEQQLLRNMGVHKVRSPDWCQVYYLYLYSSAETIDI